MYLITERLKRKSIVILNHFELPTVVMYVPFLILVLRFILFIQKKQLDFGNLDR
jgi:hypothetical protein